MASVTPALIVVDAQVYFKEKIQPVLQNIETLLSFCRANDILTVKTQHGHRNFEKDGGALYRWWGSDLIKEGSPGHALVISPDDKDVLVQKRTYDAFWETPLHDILKEKGVNTVIIAGKNLRFGQSAFNGMMTTSQLTGTMTNLCCETTARAAFVRDFDVWFLADGTGCGDDEMHAATLKNLSYGFARVMSCEECLKLLKDVAKLTH